MALHAMHGCGHQSSWNTKYEGVADKSGCDAKWHYGKRKGSVERN